MQRDGVAPCSTAAGEIEDGGWTLSSHAELLDTAKTQSVERPSRPSAEEARGNESPVVPNTASQSGSSARRSSRRSVKPVAYWRNERVKYVFEQCDAGVPVLSIKDVVHNPPATSHCRNSKRRKVDRAEASPPSATASRESPIRASLLRRDEETEPFVSTKEVHADANTVNPDHIPTLPHGPAPTAITVSDYSSGKKVTLDLVRLLENVNPTEVVPGGFLVEQVFKFGNFCGAGVLIFETGAEKPPKNTRGHVMIFYVTAGCLRVRLHETEFEAAKGTFFAVPQGNVYSMLNAEKETASVLFLQARQIAER
ncbi:Mif2/CENP-C like-domain-containing protein [Zopfochytrium polystomum]|nr:Mif2/CENP-C like-domain-containing protein [Zopfochytrium polystomum]